VVPYEEMFKSLAEKFCKLLAKNGISVSPYRDQSLNHFRYLSVSRKLEIIYYLRINCKVIEEFYHEGQERNKTGATPPSVQRF
jgi:hypothetical protein